MNTKFFKRAAVILAIGLIAASCQKKLNVQPITGVNPANVYDNVADISDVLAKVYSGFTLSGPNPGASDLGNYDPGTSVLYRMYWCAEELSADQVKIAWNDGNLPDYNTQSWNANNDKIHLLYDRLFYQISVCNEFLRNLPPSKVSSFSTADQATINTYIAEVRFCRALTYWMAIDCFGNIPFATETSSVGTTPPKKATRTQVFNFLTSELTAIQANLLAPATNYGRADQACAWYLMAKLYLNAGVYTGTTHYDSAVYFCQKVMGAGYTLAPKYLNLFKIDNKATSSQEIIFPLMCSGTISQSYGNSTFLVNAQVGGTLNPSLFGISSGWGGYRATPTFVSMFPNPFTTTDTRCTFDSTGQTLEMTTLLNYPSGYALQKFRNVDTFGLAGSEPEFCDLDIPLFRLGDVYLMYAEAAFQTGDAGDALKYVNKVRERAGATDMSSTNFNADSVLAERGRELYCEGSRRTDLIRFGLFSGGTYLWSWKGGVENGTSISANYNLFPIPATDLNSNPNLTQNPGY